MTVLRPARLDDMTALRALETACFGPDAWSELSIAAELAGVPDTRSVLVVEDAGEVVAYGCVLMSARTADVQRIAVRPDHWRTGLGRRLLTTLLGQATEHGCVEALLEVREDNEAAIALYQRRGFETIARRAGYYQGGTVDALVLRLQLAPLDD